MGHLFLAAVAGGAVTTSHLAFASRHHRSRLTTPNGDYQRRRRIITMKKPTLRRPGIGFFLLLWLWWPAPLPASGPAQEANLLAPQRLAVDYFEDPTNSLTIAEIAAPAFANRFQPGSKKRFNFGFSPSSFWFRFQIPRTRSTMPNPLLEVDCPLIDQVTLYQADGQGRFQTSEAGELTPIAARPLAARNPVFPLLPPGVRPEPTYLRCQEQGSVFLALNLWTPTGFAHKNERELYLLSFYYLILLGLAIYNGVVFCLIRVKSYAYYLAFIGSFLLWQLTYNGLAGQYLWPGHPGFSNLVIPLAINATGLSALRFCQSFLHTKKQTPRLHRLLSHLLYLLGGALLLCLQPFSRISIIAAALLVILYTPLLLLTGCICWRQGSRPAGYYTVAWVAFLLGSLLLALKSFGLLPSHPLTEYSQQIGAIIELCLLSLALVDQYRLVRLEKEAMQVAALVEREEAQQRLTALVAEKTRELQANARHLEELSGKLAKYLSPQLYEAIFSGRAEVKLNSTRKMLTVFFSDIKNFTRLTDTIESEELTTFLNEYLNEMAKIALHYGGTIDKFIGDGIMVFFGDPESKGVKEDALACLQMALAMRATVLDFKNREFAYLLADPLHIRIGINTGYCTVGNFGSENRLDYTIIGGQVNLAARLEGAAAEDEILISAKTYELVKGEFLCRKKIRLAAKGIAHPVTTYSVIGRQPHQPLLSYELQPQSGEYTFRYHEPGRGE